MARCRFEYNRWAISYMMSLDRVSRMRFPFGEVHMLSFQSIWGSCLTIARMDKHFLQSLQVFYD